MTDLRAQLQATLGATYTIEKELGGGGMSRVFVALERSLDRRVVIKVLSPDIAAELSARRFAREIRLAASLQQANIVPVISTGEVAGIPYYTMPFVEGLSLRERLRRDAIVSIPEAVSVLRDVVRALSYAHEHGVVHRDIKPDNVLLSGHSAVVTDFGIAKAVTIARQGPNSEGGQPATFTQAGTAIGTPAYMAPEQIAGDSGIDHRADFYSLGCMAYELLSGKPPFEAQTSGRLLAAHLSERPKAIEERRDDCPNSLARLVMQCLEKDPEQRPQSASDILRGLDAGASRGAVSLPFLRQRRRALAAAAMLVVLAGSIAFAMARIQRRSSAPPPTRSVAVLPFSNEGGDSTQDNLSTGMADGLATALGKVSGIRVISRTLTYRYRGLQNLDAQSVGKALDAGYLVHATIRRLGDRLRVSAQVLNASDNSEFWSEDYERNASQAYSIQDDLAGDIAIAFQGKTAGTNVALLRSTTTIGTADPQAYDLYLRGRYLLERRGPGVAQAVDNFQQAITRDTTFARAYAGLAVALELLPYFSDADTKTVAVRAIPAATRALALDSTLAEAYTALGIAYSQQYQWDQSLSAHRSAVALNSQDASARLQYARVLHYTGHLLEAKAQFERARMLDPYSAVASGWLGHLLWLTGHHDEALVELNRAMQLDSVSPPALFMAAQASLIAHDTARSRIFAERLWNRVPAWRQPAAGILARLGYREKAEAILKTTGPSDRAFGAMLYLSLGDTARALSALERAAANRTAFPTDYSLSEIEYDSIRRSPRFAAIVRGVGLDERIFTAPTGGRPQ
jgi:serine/threonine-protein kinase